MYRRWTTIIAIFTLLMAPAAFAQPEHIETYGTVTAKDATTLTIKTDEGQMVRFRIDEQSMIPESLSVGDEVAVHHLAGTFGDNEETDLQPIEKVLIADEFDGSEDQVAVTAHAEVDVDTTDNDQLADVDADFDAEADFDADNQFDNDFDNDRALPQTASPLAALALLGLAAIGGAAGLRRWRS